MKHAESDKNPLQPLSLPMAIRAVLAASLAVLILLRSAPEMIGGFIGTSAVGLLAALTLFACAIWDGLLAFRTGLRLPERSLESRGIDATYTTAEIRSLMLSNVSPNEKYLSRVGRWSARASDRFYSLPHPYQRLVEVAMTAAGLMIIAALLMLLLQAFGQAGHRPDVSNAVVSWLFSGFIVIGYAYWFVMFVNIYSAEQWSKKLSASGIVKALGAALIVIILLAFVTQFLGVSLPAISSLQPYSTIMVAGTIAMVIGILGLAWLRSDTKSSGIDCSRIQLSDSAAAHPQSILNALKSVLSQSRGGMYSMMGDWTVKLNEQKNMSGGTFFSSIGGEYEAVLQPAALPKSIRRYAIVFAIIGIATGAAGYVMLWNAAYDPVIRHWIVAAGLLLFSSLALSVASFPLTETLWTSYIMAIDVEGSYQGRGAVMMAADTNTTADYGSILVDYSLAGGVASALSISFLSSAMVKADGRRFLVHTESAASERDAIVDILQARLARTTGGAPRNRASITMLNQ